MVKRFTVIGAQLKQLKLDSLNSNEKSEIEISRFFICLIESKRAVKLVVLKLLIFI